MALSLSIALVTLALVRRPLHPVLTVAWQLRGSLAAGSLILACLLVGLGHAIPAALIAASAGLVVGRLASERFAARIAPRSRHGDEHWEGPLPMLSVVTHNCGDHRSDPTRIAEFLADCGADLRGGPGDRRGPRGRAPAPPRASHPHQVLHPDGVSGIGLLSRYPISETRLDPGSGTHPYLVATVDTPAGDMHVVVAHPSAKLALRGSADPAVGDLARLAEEAAENAPAVFMGDFNTTDATAGWDALDQAGLVDAYRAVGGGIGATFPVPLRYLYLPVPPLVRIDFVFATRDLMPSSAHVGPTTTSDHLPLFASFALSRTGEAAGWRSRVG